jgi:Divergent InlB B-repeat domain/S-layer homology domain/Putative binding domain, N-terminal
LLGLFVTGCYRMGDARITLRSRSPGLVLFLLLCFADTAVGQGVLSLSSASGSPGTTVNLNLVVSMAATASPAALQWEIHYSIAEISSITVVAGPVATSADKTLACAPGSSVVRCAVYGLNAATIPDGVVAMVQLTLAPSIANTFAVVTLSSGFATDPTGSSIASLVTTSGIVFVSQGSSFTVATNPAGLGVVVDGASFATSPQSFPWLSGTSHSIGVNSPQTAGAVRNVFTGWNDGGAQSHLVTATTPATYTATFQSAYLLSTSVNPPNAGTIQLAPASLDGYYASGTIVQLTATAGTGYQFANWAGDTAGSTMPVSVLMSGPRAVNANFTASGPCSFLLSRLSFTALAEGDMGRVDVATRDGCNWSAATDSPWIVINSGVSGTSGGPVRFTAAPNPSTSLRSGVITAAGQVFVVWQAGAGCTSGISLVAPGPESAVGGLLSLGIFAPAGCQWSMSSAPGWLTVQSSGQPAQILADANSGSTPRTGSISAGGYVAQVIQASSTPVQVFTDVPLTHPYADHISLLRLHGITSGCSPTEFCPDASTTRGQMAVFIMRAVMGGDSFSFSQAPAFTDVAVSHPYFKYIQKMRELGITSGCSVTEYCPDAPVTRGQMAVFLIHARLNVAAGQSFPYPQSTYFQDVLNSHVYYSFIQKLRQLGITAGCSVTTYCPDAPATRGQMAVFVIRAFFTP